MKVLLLAVLSILALERPGLSASQYLIRFKEHLRVSSDLKLTGVRTSAGLRFTSESTWKPVSGSALHLFIDHSPDLDGNRSFLSVTLNYGVLRSVRLDDHNRSLTEIVIPLPPDMLRPDNEILFSVEQFPGARKANELWTAIKPASFIAVQYEENRPALDLRLLPSPLVDPRSYRPQQLSVLLPVRPSSQTLEATALLIANYAAGLGESLSVRPVRSIDAASGSLLIVGTPEEQPLRLLDQQLPFRFFRIGNEIRLGGRQAPFDAREGIVALIERAGPVFNPVLVATGNTPEAVSRAVRKIIEGGFEGPVTFARIAQDVQMPPAAPRDWKGFIPPANHFTLAQIGLRELKFDSQNNFSQAISLAATPDAQFLKYGHQMALAFRLNSDLSVENAKLDVDLNGSMLGEFKAAEFSTGSRMSLRVKIPGRLLGRQNVLKLAWRGINETSDNDPALWLLPTSEFDLPRDYQSNLPDLTLLRFGLFPFALKSDLADVLVVTPVESSGETVAALYEFAGLLGRLVPSDRFAFGVKRADALTAQARSAANIIVFSVDELPEQMQSRKALAGVQESVSPWNPENYLLSITSGSAAVLHGAVKTVFSEAVLKQLRGDTAYVFSDGVTSFQSNPVRQVSEYSYFTHLQAWLRENWIALPVILATASCLLFVGLRLVLVQYKSRKSNA